MPPITTNSTPPASSRRMMGPAWNLGHSGTGDLWLYLVDERPHRLVLMIVALDALARREPERLDDLRVVHARGHLRRAQLERPVHHVQRALQRRDAHVVAGRLEPRDRRLGDAEPAG